MTTQNYNANVLPVVQGKYVSNSSGLNHPVNNSQISDALARKQQDEIDQHMSYYAATNRPTRKIISLHVDTDASIPRGEVQPKACRDVFWAILFYTHVIAIGYATVRFGPLMASDMASQYAEGAQRWLQEQLLLGEGDNDNDGDASNFLSFERNRNLEEGENGDQDFDLTMNTIWTILAVSGAAGFLISSLAMSLMMTIPTAMIKIALAFNLIVTAGACLLSIMIGAIGVAVMTGIGLLFTIYYTYIVWKRIPYAASTLVTALTAVKFNMGLAVLAYNNLVVTFLWTLWWSTAFVATSYVMGDCNAEGYCENEINGFLVFLFLVSFFWTAQVVKNVVHVTVAGTVGTWWFVPGEAHSCCSSAVRSSYWRSITTCFGSICFGSLIVAVIQATREIVNSMRTEENGLLLCLIDCILQIIERIAEYFNKWAYVYVGLYGYGFVEASVNVLSLFQARGWSSIIADYLVDTVLLMVSICVGVITGIIGAVLGSFMEQDGAVVAGAFLVGAAIGFVLCSTLFGLVSSAVNAVIVCFAEAPAEFQSNHPLLSHEMVAAWREAYPTEFGY